MDSHLGFYQPIVPWFNYAMWVLSWLPIPCKGKHELTCLLLFTFWFVWRLHIFLFSYQLIDNFGRGFVLCCLYLEIISSNFIERMLNNIESSVKEVIMLILKVLLTSDYAGGGIVFRDVQTRPEAHPASCAIGTGPFPGEKSGRGVVLTNHFLLMSVGERVGALLALFLCLHMHIMGW